MQSDKNKFFHNSIDISIDKQKFLCYNNYRNKGKTQHNNTNTLTHLKEIDDNEKD